MLLGKQLYNGFSNKQSWTRIAIFSCMYTAEMNGWLRQQLSTPRALKECFYVLGKRKRSSFSPVHAMERKK